MSNTFNLNGKVALVQGGSRGIGAAIVRRLAKEGAKVAFTYVSATETAATLVADIHAEGEKDFGSFGARGSDDRIFILPLGDRAMCDAAFPK